MATITLPTPHVGQVEAYAQRTRFQAIRCGRRWGKTIHGEIIACNSAGQGFPVGFFAPDYKILSETYRDISDILDPIKRSASRIDGVIRTTVKKGRVDFWTLNNDRAGRSRFYKTVVIDEAAFTEPNMMDIWDKSIKPTLLDLNGTATVLSNTNGIDPENFFYQICNDPKHGFSVYHAPTRANPFMPAAEIDRLKETTHPLVFAQEYEAEFVDWSGVQFFDLEKLLDRGLPVDMPKRCDGVFAIVDTALKTGKEHDGTAVSYWAISKHFGPKRLICLDWDLVQIEGSMLDVWFPAVARRLEELAAETHAMRGVLGAWIEDKGSGTVLLQQAGRNKLNAYPIDSKLTAMGKDERAVNASGPVFQGMVKISRSAFEKTTNYKGITRNQLMAQVLGFRLADKNAATRADDLLDTFCYAVAIGLGNQGGF